MKQTKCNNPEKLFNIAEHFKNKVIEIENLKIFLNTAYIKQRFKKQIPVQH